LEKADQAVLPGFESSRAVIGRIRPIEGNLPGLRTGVEIASSPGVVSLMRQDGGLEKVVRRPGVVPNHEDDVALTAAGARRQLDQIDSARPIGRIARVRG